MHERVCRACIDYARAFVQPPPEVCDGLRNNLTNLERAH
jgi:hypothetical protein